MKESKTMKPGVFTVVLGGLSKAVDCLQRVMFFEGKDKMYWA